MKTVLAIISIGLCLLAGQVAFAKTPPEILTPYKEFRAALEAGDFTQARRAAKSAWQEAEARMGDSKLTGDLAYNYGAIIEDMNADKDQVKAVQRSMELVDGYGEDAVRTYLERGIKLTVVMDRAGKANAIGGVARNLVDYAEEAGATNSTFYAEALTILAGMRATKGKNKDTMKLTQKALDVFSNADDGILSAYPLQAVLYQGYAYEGEEDHFKAALNYQKVMEATDGLDPEEVELVGETLGRWIYMRGALKTSGQLEDAEQAGLCQCWPYDKPRREDILPISRKPPKMPSTARQSGYVVVEFDLDDSGKPVNERVITAWPDYFEQPALKSLEKWEYTPRQPEHTDEDRSDIVTTITFRLADHRGNIIW